MRRVLKLIAVLAAVVLLSGCAMATVEDLYCLPKRSEEYENLQVVIDKAMTGLTYSAPVYGENRHFLQAADLDGDGIEEYLLFAKDDSERPLKILIFCQLASGYVLMDTIEGYGFVFDFVRFAQMDDHPGLELVVGRQLSDQVMGNVSIYRFISGFSRQLMSTSYSDLTITDLDNDGISELFLLTPGMSEKSYGTARLFRYEDGELQRSAEIQVSAPISGFKMMESGRLQDGRPVVFVTSASDNSTLVTDIFGLDEGTLTSIMKGITVESIQNFFVYPSDMDDDGVLELPTLVPIPEREGFSRQEYLIEWYSLSSDGTRNFKECTYHNFTDNWLYRLEKGCAEHLSVKHIDNSTMFYWDGELVLTIVALTDADREEQAKQPGWSILYSSESVIYVAFIEENTSELDLFIKEEIMARFSPIRVDLNSEKD